MFLGCEYLERLVLLLPHLVDLQNEIGLVIAHFGLVRLEQKYRRSRILVFCIRLVPHRLSDHSRLLYEVRGVWVVKVVGVLKGVSEHKGRAKFPIDIDHAVEMRFIQLERIVAAVEEFDFRPEKLCGPFRFVPAAGLYLFKRGARLFPSELALSTFAIRQADNLDAVTPLGVQGDRAAGAPNKIAGMSSDDEPGLWHCALL